MSNQNTLREATRLTQAGQLTEATALLQRVLRGERARCGIARPGAHPSSGPRAAHHRPQGQRRWQHRPRSTGGDGRRHGTSAPAVVRSSEGRHLARPAGRQTHACFDDRHRSGGSEVHRRHLQQQGRKPDLQAIRPQRLPSGAAASASSDAPWLHPVAGRFRSWYQNELHRRRTYLHGGLSGITRRRQPLELLELVSRNRSAPR
jgi:hypothetical protein